MKKIFVLALALCLAVPALSYAGNATSRFDLNIGGTLKVDFGWSDDYAGPGTLQTGGLPARDVKNTSADKYGQQLWGAGESGLNFFVRGPDAWGAKTSAFIAGDFTGFWGASGYNTFDLVIAQINFDWANTSFSMGQGPQIWGKLPTWSQQLGWNEANYSDKGSTPAVMNAVVTQRFTKEWSAKFGISSPWAFTANYNTEGPKAGPPPNVVGGQLAQSDIPVFQGGVTYSSGACGKVGPWQLTFATDGWWGKFKQIYTNANGNVTDKDVDTWGAEFKFLVPIIPEKNGNKTGALYVDGDIVTRTAVSTPISQSVPTTGEPLRTRDSPHLSSPPGQRTQVTTSPTSCPSTATICTRRPIPAMTFSSPSTTFTSRPTSTSPASSMT